MTTAPPAQGSTQDPTATTVAAEQVSVSTEWVESGRLRLRRRVVSETRTIEVAVRREELIVEGLDVVTTPVGDGPVGDGPVGECYVGTSFDGPPVAASAIEGFGGAAELVLLLREEVPVVTVRPQVYQRVTASMAMVTHDVVVPVTKRREDVVVERD